MWLNITPIALGVLIVIVTGLFASSKLIWLKHLAFGAFGLGMIAATTSGIFFGQDSLRRIFLKDPEKDRELRYIVTRFALLTSVPIALASLLVWRFFLWK